MTERTSPPVRAIRRAQRLTQKALAARVGVAPNTIRTWENRGRCPHRWILESVAAALGAPVASLDPGCWAKRTRVRYGDDPAALELRRLRRAAGLSADQVAAVIGTTRSAVRFWETGRGSPDPRYRETLARLFGVETLPLPGRVAARAEGASLSAVRERAGLSKMEAARRLGVSIDSVRAWECGIWRPSRDRITALARLYGVDAATIEAGLGQPPDRLVFAPQRLREARRARGWSQQALAERAGVSANSIARWEAMGREPKRETWRRVADALGARVEDLAEPQSTGAPGVNM
jgi:transcriptional regulator with XRE-family HTH domain